MITFGIILLITLCILIALGIREIKAQNKLEAEFSKIYREVKERHNKDIKKKE